MCGAICNVTVDVENVGSKVGRFVERATFRMLSFLDPAEAFSGEVVPLAVQAAKLPRQSAAIKKHNIPFLAFKINTFLFEHVIV